VPQERTAGRRSSDQERKHLRELEKSVRNFIAYYEDHKEEFFAPKTRQLVAEAREIIKPLDELRAQRGVTRPEAEAGEDRRRTA